MIDPFFVGVAGGTGSGKSTVANKIADSLPSGSSVVIEHDCYYKDHADLPLDQRAQLNYDHPDALDNDLLLNHLATLKSGKKIDMPQYDFIGHRRQEETKPIAFAPVVILEGILVFVDPRINNFLNLKIYVDTDADIRIMRRVRRDIEVRGRDFASIREQYYNTVRPMHLKFVEPSKASADLIIPEGGNNQVALDTIVGKLLYILTVQNRVDS